MQMLDVHLPTTDGRELVLSRTEPDADQRLLLAQLKLQLPEELATKNRFNLADSTAAQPPCSADLRGPSLNKSISCLHTYRRIAEVGLIPGAPPCVLQFPYTDT